MIKSRRILFESPGVVKNQTIDFDDSTLQPTDVLIENNYSLISTGTETAMLAGTEYWFPLPGVPGYSAVGTIIKKGDQVSNVHIGDQVFYRGRHEQHIIVDAEQPNPGKYLIPVLPNVELSTSPMVCMAAIAMTSVRVSHIVLGDYVAITGQGLIGIMAMQLARLQGGRTIAIDISDFRLDIAKSLGADYIINPAKEDLTQRIREITHQQGVNTWIEATGSPKVIDTDLALLPMARHGDLILLGSPRGDYGANLANVLRYCHLSETDTHFIGAHEKTLPIYPSEGCKFSMENCTRLAMELIAEMKIRLDGLVTKIAKPDEASEIYKLLQTDKEHNMGFIFDWT